MLYFSKLKIITIYTIIIFLSIFSLSNLIHNQDTNLLSKKINLGLDLQGGSYLLLEVDSSPIVIEKLQAGKEQYFESANRTLKGWALKLITINSFD